MDKDIVFFDGVCNLCSGSVQWLLRHDKKQQFNFSSLQGEYASKIITDPELKKTDSIILFSKGKFYSKSTAVLKIASKIGFPYMLLSGFLIIPSFMRNLVYDFIARNRYNWYGKKEECWLPAEEYMARFIK